MNKKFSELESAGALTGSELLAISQKNETGGWNSNKIEMEQIKNIFPVSISEISSETDLNTVTEPGIYLLNHPLYYDDQHHPFACYEGTKVLMIVSKVVKTRAANPSITIVQAYFGAWSTTPLGSYVRASSGTTWGNWKQITAS